MMFILGTSRALWRWFDDDFHDATGWGARRRRACSRGRSGRSRSVRRDLRSLRRSEALARIRARKREMPSEELPDMPTAEADLPTMAARRELADLIAQACGGLTDRDRLV
jgi:hypothetical protein